MRELAFVLVAFAGAVAVAATLGELLEHRWGIAAAAAALAVGAFAFLRRELREVEAGRW